MSRDSRKSIGLASALMLLGVLAMYGGLSALIVLIPAAFVVWSGTKTVVRSGRN